MEIKLDRKKNHIAASDYKEQITVIKTTSDFKIGNNVDTNKIEKRRCLFLRQRQAKVGLVRNIDLERKTSNVYNIKVIYILYIMKNHGEIHYISITYK